MRLGIGGQIEPKKIVLRLAITRYRRTMVVVHTRQQTDRQTDRQRTHAARRGRPQRRDCAPTAIWTPETDRQQTRGAPAVLDVLARPHKPVAAPPSFELTDLYILAELSLSF